MPAINLPCTKCGASLPITRGSMVQCFACGTKNVFVESFDDFSRFVVDTLGYPKAIEDVEPQISSTQLNERIDVVDKLFNEYISQSRQFEYIILSKLDKIELSTEIIEMGKKLGKLVILYDAYLLPHLSNSLQRKQYLEMQNLCLIRNSFLTALVMTFEAKKEFKPDVAKSWYQNAQKNYHHIIEIAAKFEQEYPGMGFEDEKRLAQAAEKLAELYRDLLTTPPSYYADELEQIENFIKDMTDARAVMLKKQLFDLYQISNGFMFILEDLRKQEIFKPLLFPKERVLFYTQEIREQFQSARKWILEIEDRFHQLFNRVILLHSGKVLSYMEDYRSEYNLRNEEALHNFNNALSQYVALTLSDLELELADNFDLLDTLIADENVHSDEIALQFEKEKKDLLDLTSTGRNFLFDLLKNAFQEDLLQTHRLEIVSGMSDKTAAFDKKILKYINFLIERFINERNTKLLPIEDQRSLFNTSYLPILEQFVKLSFTLHLTDIPLPMFIELVVFTTAFDVEKDYRVMLLLENPSPVILENVSITFFVPNSFRIKTRILEIGKMQPGQKIGTPTNIIPTVEGKFYLMAMVSYEHSKESFWTPTVKIPITVGHPDKDDEMLKAIYQKYGVDISTVDYLKNLEDHIKSYEKVSGKSENGQDLGSKEKQTVKKMIKEIDSFEKQDIEDENRQDHDDEESQ